jgi:thiamine pyrophosphate-dependent acetolactate synthase large subunit-like protein
MATGAEVLTRGFARIGVDVVFTVIGAHALPLVLQLRASGIRVIGLHSPTAAVLAASGYARRTGSVGVAISGPGHDDLTRLDATRRARAAETPLLLVSTSPVPPALPGPPRPRAEAVEPAVGHVRAVVPLTTADDVTAAMTQARAEALRAPAGPIGLQLSPDFLVATARPEPEDDAVTDHTDAHAAGVEHVQLRRAGNLVDASQQVLIWAGGGALRAGAGGAIAELAEKVGAPVMTTVQAAGLLPARHPCLVGMPVHLPQVGQLWDDADLVIAIGTDFDEQSTEGLRLPSPENLIAINIDAVDAGRHYRPDVLLRGDARTLTKALADTVSYRGGTAVVRSRLEEVRAAVRRDLAESDPVAMDFLHSVSAALPDRVTVVADPCAAGRWLAAFHEWTLPRTLLFPDDVDEIGHALPLAIGAACAPTADPVVAVIGDQGVLRHLGALAVVADEGLPLTVLVVDDGGAGRLRPALVAAGADPAALDRPSPDHAAAARTFGLRADRVESVGEELTTALRAHISAPDPTVLVVSADVGAPPTDESRWPRRSDATR